MLPAFIYNVLAIDEQDRREEFRLYNIERRAMREASDPFALTDTHFKQLFRLTKDMAHFVRNTILPHMHNTDNVVAISPTLRCFAVFNFLATGSYQRSVGQSFFLSMSQQAVSIAVNEVCMNIVQHLGHIIRFPRTQEEKNVLKAQFMEQYGFPGTIGAIDCTHIAITAPIEEEHNYVNRKGYHSKNVQIVLIL